MSRPFSDRSLDLAAKMLRVLLTEPDKDERIDAMAALVRTGLAVDKERPDLIDAALATPDRADRDEAVRRAMLYVMQWTDEQLAAFAPMALIRALEQDGYTVAAIDATPDRADPAHRPDGNEGYCACGTWVWESRRNPWRCPAATETSE